MSRAQRRCRARAPDRQACSGALWWWRCCCWLGATRAWRANGGVFAERGSRLTGSKEGARWKLGQVRCGGAAGLRSWCACVWCRNSKRCSTASLRELRGASARCGSLLGARVGREHSKLPVQNKQCVAKNGRRPETIQSRAEQCLAADSKKVIVQMRGVTLLGEW